MTEQLADDRQAKTTASAEAGVGVTQVVNPHSVEPGAGGYRLPRLVQIGARPLGIVAGDDESLRLAQGARVLGARQLGKRRQHAQRRRIEHDRLAAGLGVWDQQQAAREVHMRPAQVQDFAQSRAGEDQQPDRSGSVRAEHGAAVLRLRYMLGVGNRFVDLPR